MCASRHWDRQLTQLPKPQRGEPETETREGYVQGPEDQKLRLIERTVDLGADGRFLIAAGDAAEIDAEAPKYFTRRSPSLLARFPSC